MSGTREDYIRYRLAKARDVLVGAEPPLEAAHYPSAVNRIYYACFYAVSALLFSEGMSASSHRGVLSLFGQHWIKTGRLPKQMSEFLRDMLDRRLQGDYEDVVAFDLEDVQAWLLQARQFVSTIAELLGETIGPAR